MSVIEILIIGTNKPIMETIARLINKGGIWKATIAFTEDEALEYFRLQSFKMVLLCAGLGNELLLKEKLFELKPNIPVVKHYGSGSGLLFTEIHQTLGLS